MDIRKSFPAAAYALAGSRQRREKFKVLSLELNKLRIKILCLCGKNPKTFLYFLFIFFMFNFSVLNAHSGSLSSQDEEKNQLIELKSTNLEFNLGSVGKDKIVKKVIKIRNKLNQALKITDARSTCECIKIVTLAQTVERNGIFEVEITFDSRGMAGGQGAEEVVYILTGNKEYELVRLAVTATIVK